MTGFLRNSAARRRMLMGQVAVKNMACRCGLVILDPLDPLDPLDLDRVDALWG